MSLNQSKGLREVAKKICRDLRINATLTENKFWERVRNRKFLGKKFYRQYPIFFDTLGKETFYVADFYCHEEKLVIELDGKIHKYQKDNNKLRTELINEKGIRVVRFKNEAIEKDIDKVFNKLKKKLTQPQPLLLEREGALKKSLSF